MYKQNGLRSHSSWPTPSAQAITITLLKQAQSKKAQGLYMQKNATPCDLPRIRCSRPLTTALVPFALPPGCQGLLRAQDWRSWQNDTWKQRYLSLKVTWSIRNRLPRALKALFFKVDCSLGFFQGCKVIYRGSLMVDVPQEVISTVSHY